MAGKEFFAALNSCLNGLSALLLIAAFIFVRRRWYYAHGCTMVTALLSSAAFLACYLYSHYRFGEITTGIPKGWFRNVYFAVLAPHVLLAIVMLPMIFLTVFRAARREWVQHRRIARPTWGIWLYVSVTGVLIYFLLYKWYPALYPEAARAAGLLSGSGT